MKTVEPIGAGVQDLCGTLLTSGGGAWSKDGVILFPASVLGGLMQVPAAGGTPVPATDVPDEMKGEAHRYPQFLPDGRRFLYVVTWTTAQRGGLYLASLDGGAPRLVSSDVRSRIVLAGTTLLYAVGGTLYARPFDPEQAQLTGEPRVILRNEVAAHWRFGEVPISALETGILVFQSRLTYNSQLVSYDRSGRETGTGILGPRALARRPIHRGGARSRRPRPVEHDDLRPGARDLLEPAAHGHAHGARLVTGRPVDLLLRDPAAERRLPAPRGLFRQRGNRPRRAAGAPAGQCALADGVCRGARV